VRYVALLAFNKIVLTHPYLVARQEDVIMDCLDSADISIRLRALDLVSGMVSSDNLMTVVGRLMRQLRSPVTPSLSPEQESDRAARSGVDPMADSDDETPEINIKTTGNRVDTSPLLPDEYKVDVISRILEMCAANNYGNLLDFDWYIDVLLQLVRNAPLPNPASLARIDSSSSKDFGPLDISEKVGDELRNIAVKVKAVRATASRAAESLILVSYNGSLAQIGTGQGALRPIAWIVGEYASYLSSPEDVLNALLQIVRSSSSPECLAVYLQAIPKIFTLLAGDERVDWTSERKTMTSLLMARIIHTLEPLASHPDLEVQERAVEFAELLRLAAEASAGQEATADEGYQDTPLLLTQAIPSLFAGLELNSVAPGAQRNVPLPNALDLDQPINSRLNELLQTVDTKILREEEHDEFEAYYNKAPIVALTEPAINRLAIKNDDTAPSYQQGSGESYLDPDIVARRRAERRERNKDDPFYIAGADYTADVSTPLDSIIQNDNDDDLDIDSIPIMQLDLGQRSSTPPEATRSRNAAASRARQLIQVAADENLTSGTSTPRHDDSELNLESTTRARPNKAKNSLLLVDSSSIGAFSLEGDENAIVGFDLERQQREDAEMAKAMQEIERLRLEMQRANERIQAGQGVPPEGTLVKKKVKKKSKPLLGEDELSKPRKKKAKKPTETMEGPETSTALKRAKKKGAQIDEGENMDGGGGGPAP
jgi:AP-3 complex subunit delta-1